MGTSPDGRRNPIMGDIPESQAPKDPRQWGVGRGKPLLLNLDLGSLSRVLFWKHLGT
jgi:hypothetical protein